MVEGWLTIVLLAFGIIVAVIGVIAYLRMFRKDRLQETTLHQEDVSSPNLTFTAASQETMDPNPLQSEKIDTRD